MHAIFITNETPTLVTWAESLFTSFCLIFSNFSLVKIDPEFQLEFIRNSRNPPELLPALPQNSSGIPPEFYQNSRFFQLEFLWKFRMEFLWNYSQHSTRSLQWVPSGIPVEFSARIPLTFLLEFGTTPNGVLWKFCWNSRLLQPECWTLLEYFWYSSIIEDYFSQNLDRVIYWKINTIFRFFRVKLTWNSWCSNGDMVISSIPAFQGQIHATILCVILLPFDIQYMLPQIVIVFSSNYGLISQTEGNIDCHGCLAAFCW